MFQSRIACWPFLLLTTLTMAGCAAQSAPPEESARAAVAPAPQQPAKAHEITIDNFTYGPPSITVPVGAKVTWVNRDDVPHTVTSPTKPRLLDSPAMDTDGSFSHVFNQPGTYAYFCAVHPKMTGVVIVK